MARTPLPARSTSFAEARPTARTSAPWSAALAVPAPASFGAVSLRYLARSPIIVRGPATGTEYRFSAAHPVQRVARADREALLRSGHFSLDG
jgi:hypothetical protein